MSGPDFLIIGAMKCGTSTLQAQLAAQTGVFMTTPKEPNYFSDDDVFAKGPGWYAGLFDEAEPGEIKGEASTHYTKLPTYPKTLERLTGAVSAPKLVYVLRDPIVRAVSHYIHEWSQGIMGSDMEAEFERHPEIVDYGRYAFQIAPYVTAFGAEAVQLVSLEAIKSDPQRVLEAVAAHIGFEQKPVWKDDLGARNVSSERVRKLPLHGLLIDNPVAAALRRTLVPKGLRDRIRKARTMGNRPELPDSLRTRLAEIYLEDRAHLATLFPGHPVLREVYPFAGDV